MQFYNANSEISFCGQRFSDFEDALSKLTHLAIGAHQDDIEIMAMHGIAECFKNPNLFFGAIVCSNGGGSARSGRFSNFSDEEMMEVRKEEQIKASNLAKYSLLAQLGYESAQIKTKGLFSPLANDLFMMLSNSKLDILYIHNLMDKHDTHVALALKTISVLKQLPKNKRPKKIIGCEVWRGLDWIVDSDKVQMNIDVSDQFISNLVNVFVSQVEGGKRYDLATLGRMYMNSTFSGSHAVDKMQKVWNGIDLTPLIDDLSSNPLEYVKEIEQRVFEEINKRIERYL